MCLALPAEIIANDPETETATVSLGGVRKTISTALVGDVPPGSFVLVHVGYALNLISAEEAQRTLEMMAETGLLEGEAVVSASTHLQPEAGR